MDNKPPEFDFQPDNPRIKEGWIFPEMHSNYRVLAVDDKNLMISYLLRGGDINKKGLSYNDEDYPHVDLEIAEYNFENDYGKPKQTRERTFSKRPNFASNEWKKPDRMFPDFNEVYAGYLNYIGIKKAGNLGEIDFDFRNSNIDDGYTLTFSANKDEDQRARELAGFSYDPSDGRLINLRVGGLFERRKSGDIESPKVIFRVGEDYMLKILGETAKSQLKRHSETIGPQLTSGAGDDYGIHYKVGRGRWTEADEDRSNAFSCLDKDLKGFDFTYKIENGFIIVSQTYTEDGTVKTFKAPLGLNLQAVEKSILPDPPCDENGVIDLKNAPWQDIDQTIGADISYSHPHSDQQKNET